MQLMQRFCGASVDEVFPTRYESVEKGRANFVSDADLASEQSFA